MKLSIITINYNNCSGLQKTLHSIISQTCRDFEWIVIDGGSSDGSRDIIEQYQDEMAYWCSEPDNGIYHAMNKGIVMARGEYLQFLNSGDVFRDNRVVEDVFPYLKGSDIYLSNMYLLSQIGKPVVNPEDLLPSNILNTMIFRSIMHPSSYIKKECFEKYGKYDEKYHIVSDWWFFFKAIVINNVTVNYIPVISVVFDETGISSSQPCLALKERREVYRENKSLGQLMIFYQDNYEIIHALKSNRVVFYFFRVYFCLYRKFHQRKTL